jgi:hemerythrin superfamily protein
MGDPHANRTKAAMLPEGDLVAILLTQHARMKELLNQVATSKGIERKELFAHFAATLKAHDAAEEAVVRPVSEETAGPAVADARNAEESKADELVDTLLRLDVDSAEFDATFGKLKQMVLDHAEAEESEEFSTIESERSEEERQEPGREFLAEFRAAGGSG